MTFPITLILPPATGPLSGGDIYNQELARALRERGHVVSVLGEEAGRGRLLAGESEVFVCDSLLLHEVPSLRQANQKGRPLWLLLHYLPTLVRLGRTCTFDELTPTEQEALVSVDGVMVTGEFLRALVQGWTEVRAPLVYVEPGVPPLQARRKPESLGGLPRGVLVAALTPTKGVLTFLEALDRVCPCPCPFRLEHIGTTRSDPAYARACGEFVQESRALRDAVTFRGELSQPETFGVLGGSDIFVSVSRMESYGMALSEARAHGLVVLALPGGNVEYHVNAKWGGELHQNTEAVAHAFLSLCQSPDKLSLRKAKARAHAWERAWALSAEQFHAGIAPTLASPPSSEW